MKERDFTPTGIRIESAYENDRNAEASELFKAILRETHGVGDVIIAHHLVYVVTEKRGDFTYQVVEEIPSADTMIFDHDIARKIWGEGFKNTLARLACEPADTRDKLLSVLFYGRRKQ